MSRASRLILFLMHTENKETYRSKLGAGLQELRQSKQRCRLVGGGSWEGISRQSATCSRCHSSLLITLGRESGSHQCAWPGLFDKGEHVVQLRGDIP